MSVDSFKKIHFIGIGGVSMSGLALIMHAMGKSVSGSDQQKSDILKMLKNKGIDVNVGHKPDNITSDLDLVVVTAAITADNVELKQAEKLGIPVWRRSQLIGYLMRDKIGVAVAGMHGKSTTTAMLSAILVAAGEDPTVIAGAEIKEIGAAACLGKSDLLVAEACEYNRSFLDFEPTIAIVTNIEEEHLDTYGDLEGIMASFQAFAEKLPVNEGWLIGCLDDGNVLRLMNDYTGHKVGYGFNQKPDGFNGVYWQIVEYKWRDGRSFFQVMIDDEKLDEEFELAIPGKFNVLNAVAAIITADFLVIEVEVIKKALAGFAGAVRRFDRLGEVNNVLLIDDYGHHPTEIKNSIAAVNDFYPEKELWVVFWPHQYSRTEQFFADFASSFNNVDKVVVLDIYEARPVAVDKKKINSEVLTQAIQQAGGPAIYIPDYVSAAKYIRDNIKSGSVLLVQGAGPTEKFIDEFRKKNIKRSERPINGKITS